MPGHAAASRQARLSVQMPSSSISPVSSAIGMNSAGEIGWAFVAARPADQSLGADNAAVHGTANRLIEHHQRVHGERASQIAGDFDALAALPVERIVEHADAIAAFLPGLIHGDFATTQQLLGRKVGVVGQCDADVGTDGDDAAADIEGLGEEARKPFAQFVGPIRHAGFVDDNGEFIAANPNQVALARQRPKTLRHLAQQLVADVAAIGVVDLVHGFQLDAGKRQVCVIAMFVDDVPEVLEQRGAVGQAAERIVGGGVARQNLCLAHPRKAARSDDDQHQHGQGEHGEHADDARLQPGECRAPRQPHVPGEGGDGCAIRVGERNGVAARGRGGRRQGQSADQVVRGQPLDACGVQRPGEDEDALGIRHGDVACERNDRPERNDHRPPDAADQRTAGVRGAGTGRRAQEPGQRRPECLLGRRRDCLAGAIGEYRRAIGVEKVNGVEEDRIRRRRDERVVDELLIDLAVELARGIVPDGVVAMGVGHVVQRRLNRRLDRLLGQGQRRAVDLAGDLVQRDDQRRGCRRRG